MLVQSMISRESITTEAKTSFGPDRTPKLEVLQRSVIARCKMDRKKDVEYLSTNDIVTAALCGAINSSDVIFMAMDNRGVSFQVFAVSYAALVRSVKLNRLRQRAKGCTKETAGNFETVVLLPREACADNPNKVRKAVQAQRGFEKGTMGCSPFCRGRFGLISNWSSLQEFVVS